VITKPGGIILSEATVKNVPIVLLGATPGQEKENALFFQNAGAAIFCEKWGQIAEETENLVMNEERLKEMKSSLAEIAVPDAANTIVEDVLDCYLWKKEKIMR